MHVSWSDSNTVHSTIPAGHARCGVNEGAVRGNDRVGVDGRGTHTLTVSAVRQPRPPSPPPPPPLSPPRTHTHTHTHTHSSITRAAWSSPSSHQCTCTQAHRTARRSGSVRHQSQWARHQHQSFHACSPHLQHRPSRRVVAAAEREVSSRHPHRREPSGRAHKLVRAALQSQASIKGGTQLTCRKHDASCERVSYRRQRRGAPITVEAVLARARAGRARAA
jgi:hypothetical protein